MQRIRSSSMGVVSTLQMPWNCLINQIFYLLYINFVLRLILKWDF